MSGTKESFKKYHCPKCGVVMFEYDPLAQGFLRVKCRNRHCGKIIPVWLDGAHEKK